MQEQRVHTTAAGGTQAPGDPVERRFREHGQVLYNLAARILQSGEEAADAVRGFLLSTDLDAGPAGDADGPEGPALLGAMRTRLVGSGAPPDRRRGGIDLWSLCSGSLRPGPAGSGAGPDQGGRDVVRALLQRQGAVSTSVLSTVYFGGTGIRDAGLRLSMTPSECRSRLHGCLESLAGASGSVPPEPGHDARFQVCAAADALGALDDEDAAEFREHLERGCARCRGDIERYARAAHRLPLLLPDLRMPDGLLETIRRSERASGAPGGEMESRPGTGGGSAGIPPAGEVANRAPEETARTTVADDMVTHEAAGPGTWDDTVERFPHDPADEDGAGTRDGAETGDGGGRAGIPGGPAGAGRGRRIGKFRRWAPVLLAAAGFGAAAAGIAVHAGGLRAVIDDQAELIESMQAKQAQLTVRYDRLAGISEFFEARSVLVVLEGTEESPGTTGKLVVDTARGIGMLQILNVPPDLAGASLRLTLGAGAEVIAEFPVGPGGPGGVYYRFFPVAGGIDPGRGAVTVEASAGPAREADGFRAIMRGGDAPPR